MEGPAGVRETERHGRQRLLIHTRVASLSLYCTTSSRLFPPFTLTRRLLVCCRGGEGMVSGAAGGDVRSEIGEGEQRGGLGVSSESG